MTRLFDFTTRSGMRLLIPVSRLNSIVIGGAGADVRIAFEGFNRLISLQLESAKREGFANGLSQDISDASKERIVLLVGSDGITSIMF